MGSFLFGGLSYSAVSKANRRFAEKLMKDKGLRRRFEKIIDSMSSVNRLTPISPSLARRRVHWASKRLYRQLKMKRQDSFTVT